MDETPERCVHCGGQVVFGIYVKDAWSHAWGPTYCQDARGFTATPLQVATPTFHGAGDVL
jgi:hypothetical protein